MPNLNTMFEEMKSALTNENAGKLYLLKLNASTQDIIDMLAKYQAVLNLEEQHIILKRHEQNTDEGGLAFAFVKNFTIFTILNLQQLH